MYVVVLVLGILAIALGAVSTGYGVTIKEFSFGNSLLMIGAISIVGGLVLIGIAGAIRELHRIVDALTGRLAPRHLRAGEPNELPVLGNVRPAMSPVRMPPPMPPMPSASPVRTGPEMRPAAARDEAVAGAQVGAVAPVVAAAVPPVDRPEAAERVAAMDLASSEQRAAAEAPVDVAASAASDPDQLSLLPADAPPVAPNAAAEPPPVAQEPVVQELVVQELVVQDLNTIPLSPHEPGDVPPRDLFTDRDAHPAEPSIEPESAAHTPPADSEPARAESPAEQPTSADANRGSAFDAIWPRRARRAAPAAGADAGSSGPSPSVDAVPPSRDETSIAPDATPPSAADTDRREPPPHPVSILKSGVVDGMAYTLYSDGSIEAELQTGTIRFASIQELRMHLERTE